MIIEAHLVPEGHSTMSGTSNLELVKDDLPPFEKEIEYRAELDRTAGTIYVHVWLSGKFNIECSRCLNNFELPIKGDFRIILQEKPGKSGRVLDDDTVDFYYDDRNDAIDISPAIYDEILVAMPLKPLCKTDCTGITVADDDIKIDFNQNRSVKQQIDPRWDALRKLKGE